MARPPDTLTRLLVDQILSTRLAGLLEDKLPVVEILEVVVGHDGLVLLIRLHQRGPPLAAGYDLGLGALGRVARALCAADVAAAGALLCCAESRATLVAGAADAHADGLVDAQDGVAVGSGGGLLPLSRLDLEAEALAEPLGALLEELRLG